MKKHLNKKTLGILAIVVVAAGLAGGALAYFTSGGSGSGTAQVGTSTDFVIHATVTPGASGIVPGGDSSDVTFTVDNPGTGHQYLNTISLTSIEAYPTAADRTAGTNVISGCGSIDPGDVANGQANDFYMADVTVQHDYAPGTGLAVTPHGTLVMNDLNRSQDACKNAFLKLNLTSN